ncbi:TetR/AcrR family transcriptional regulator [Microbulbifer marinus]|nr:TetR family transcriptional regulator [Microbulbifer marinus]
MPQQPSASSAGQSRKTSTARPGRSRRAQGEQTRNNILEAVLRLIHRDGYRAVTHRSVAKEAGVNYSLINYYFANLDELLEQALHYQVSRGQAELTDTWKQVFDYLAQFTAAERRTLAVRRQLCDHFAQVATDYVVRQIRHRPEGLVMEMTFAFELSVSAELRALAMRYRNRYLEDFVRLCRLLGSRTPEVDAQLCLGTLQRLEYEGLASGRVSRDNIHRQMHRQMAWLLGLRD